MLNLAARARRLFSHPLFLIATTDATRPGHRRSHWQLADKGEAVPAPAPFDGATPLIDLPLLALDTETTGLDPEHDRIVSLAAAPLMGARLYLHQATNFLINPACTIPIATTAIHGIADHHVAGLPPFASRAAEVATLLRNHVLLGHNIIFDAMILQQEMCRVEENWQAPPFLDTMLLYATVQPRARSYGLDLAARKLRVSLAGRHTALGDVLIALDLFYRLLPLLAERGIVTLAQAQTASRETLNNLRERHRRNG
ncbi:MAG TPA: 3'-5' exonuclease [Dongiaceae bacterium]|nr:3'-5' exonuclease [Dongiaceae bacterium]